MEDPITAQRLFARVKIPSNLRQWVRLTADAGPTDFVFVRLDEIIRASLPKLYTGMKLSGAWATDEMKDYYKHKRLAGKAIMKSGLDWTIVEPGELTDGKGTGKVTLSTEAIDQKSVSRADVAAVVVAAIRSPKTAHKALQLTSGKTAIADAIKALGK